MPAPAAAVETKAFRRGDLDRARESIGRLIVDRRITLTPKEDSIYWAEEKLSPIAWGLNANTAWGCQTVFNISGCGDRVWSLFTALPSRSIRVRLAA